MRGSLFQQGEANALRLTDFQRQLGATVELGSHIQPARRHYALALPLGRRARGRQTARHFGTKRQHPSFGSQRTQPVADNPLALTVVTHRLTQQASTHQHLVHAGLTHASAPCIT